MYGRGYLLLEAGISLLILITSSALFLYWQQQATAHQGAIHRTLRALCLARTALDYSLKARRFSHPSVIITKKKLLPTYTHITILLVQPDRSHLQFTSGVYHD